MTYAEAQAAFRVAAAEGRIPSREHGAEPNSFRALPPHRVDQIISRVTYGVSFASGRSGTAADGVDIGPLLLELDEHARMGAEHLTASGKRVVVSDVRLFVTTVLGQDPWLTPRLRVSPHMFPIPWRPIADALVRTGGIAAGGRSRRTTLSELLYLAKTAEKYGVGDPHDLPADSAPILRWAWQEHSGGSGADSRECGKARARLKAGLSAYRRARATMGKAGENLPECTSPTVWREWGIDSLQDLPSLLAAGVERLESEEQRLYAPRVSGAEPLSDLDKIFVLAPYFGDALAKYIRLAEKEAIARQPRYVQKLIGAVGKLVATMIREGLDPFDVRFEELWTRTAPIQAVAVPMARPRGRYDSDPVDDGAGESPPCLLQYLLDASLPQRIALSPLDLPQRVREGRAKYYPDSAFNDARLARYIALRVIKPLPQKRQVWIDLEAKHEELIQHMAAVNKQAPVAGRIDKGRIPLNYTQLCCIVLWYMRRKIRQADAELAALLESPKARKGSHRMVTLRERVYRLLEDYALFSVIVADGLRCKNYAGAVGGKHIIPEPVLDSAGNWIAIRSLRTHFRGDDCPSVRLKIPHQRNNIRARVWRISPAIVDFDLFLRYWRDVRQDRLRKCQLLGPEETLNLQAEYEGTGDRYAAFVTDRSVYRKSAIPSETYALQRTAPTGETVTVSGGHLTDATVRNTWARIVHEVARDVLGVSGIPATLDECRRTGSPYRGLFGPHGVRASIAWHFGSLLGRWEFSEEMTNDSYRTLVRDYAVLPRELARHRKTATLHDPLLYAKIVDWMFDNRSAAGQLDWEAFWRKFEPLRLDAEKNQWVQSYSGSKEENTALWYALSGRKGSAKGLRAPMSARGGRRGTYRRSHSS